MDREWPLEHLPPPPPPNSDRSTKVFSCLGSGGGELEPLHGGGSNTVVKSLMVYRLQMGHLSKPCTLI